MPSPLKNHAVLALAMAAILPGSALAEPAAVAPPAPASTQAPPAQGQQAIQYDSQGRYVEPQALGTEDKVWLGDDGQYHFKRKDGTTGLVIGAVVGGLFGSAITGSSTLGTILGTVGGGLLGRSIDRGDAKCQ